MTRTLLSFAMAGALALGACSSPPDDTANLLTPEEQAAGWQLLFDGETLKGWHLYNQHDVQASAWKAEDGQLIYSADSVRVEHEDLVTDKEFENYDFRFEWKISEEGN